MKTRHIIRQIEKYGSLLWISMDPPRGWKKFNSKIFNIPKYFFKNHISDNMNLPMSWVWSLKFYAGDENVLKLILFFSQKRHERTFNNWNLSVNSMRQSCRVFCFSFCSFCGKSSSKNQFLVYFFTVFYVKKRQNS